MNEEHYKFLLEEYNSLKTEIEYRVKATERIEYVAIVAVAAIFAWLIKSNEPVSAFVWWVPCLFPVVGIIRQFGLIRRLLDIAEYIRQIEDKFYSEKPLGWERFLKEKRKTNVSAVLISGSSYILWVLLLLVTLYAGFNGGFTKEANKLNQDAPKVGAPVS